MRKSQHSSANPRPSLHLHPSPETPASDSRRSFRSHWIAVAATSLALALWLAPPVDAQGTQGSSAAFGAKVLLRLVPFSGSPVTLDLGLVGDSAGQAPPHYLFSASKSGFAVTLAEAGEVLSSSMLSSAAAGTVEVTPHLSSRADAEDLAILIGGPSPLFTISAQGVAAEASMSGPCGDALGGSGTTTLSGATIGGSLGSGLTVPNSPMPDTVLLDQDGVRVVLNERSLTGSGFGSLRLAVTAIHIELDEVLIPGVGLLSGEIVVGHAEADLVCGDELSPTEPAAGSTN